MDPAAAAAPPPPGKVADLANPRDAGRIAVVVITSVATVVATAACVLRAWNGVGRRRAWLEDGESSQGAF